MTRQLALGSALFLAAAAMASTAASAERACFDAGQVRNWVSAGDQAVYLQVNTADYYRVDLPTPVRQLDSRSTNLVVGSSGSRVCDAGDLRMTLFLTPSFNVPLGATRISRLSSEEVTALGPENLPGRRYRGRR